MKPLWQNLCTVLLISYQDFTRRHRGIVYNALQSGLNFCQVFSVFQQTSRRPCAYWWEEQKRLPYKLFFHANTAIVDIIDSPRVKWLDFVTNVSSLLKKTLGYRQEIIIGAIMIFFQPCINLCSYCTLGVSAQSTRLQISVHKYLFPRFESGYFSVFKNIIVCTLLFENVYILYMYWLALNRFKIISLLFWKKKKRDKMKNKKMTVLSTEFCLTRALFLGLLFTFILTVKR